MPHHGSSNENTSVFREVLRKFMENNDGVRGVARTRASNPSSSPYRDLYSAPWVRAILTRSDIDDSKVARAARAPTPSGVGAPLDQRLLKLHHADGSPRHEGENRSDSSMLSINSSEHPFD